MVTRLTYKSILDTIGNTPVVELQRMSPKENVRCKSLMDGSILIFDGQATVFLPGQGCYRCLFPEPPPPGMVPNCAEAGVLGALTGLVGSIPA